MIQDLPHSPSLDPGSQVSEEGFPREENPENSVSPPPPIPSYRVLARRHRPRNFATLVGQEPMVRTLSNAFREGRIAHAFLLTGIRGIGKTTTARILAKGLNCLGDPGDPGNPQTPKPTTTPCGLCDSCVQILESRHADVTEIDAASHTGVEKIREILGDLRHPPSWARYRIYVIDEVHMLSVAAFNALLKTLEEPPPDVKFILATTEPGRIPVTILSRCQRFDLSPVREGPMREFLKGIATQEKISIQDPALEILAEAASGSVRDALSLLDQAIAQANPNLPVSGKPPEIPEITSRDIHQMLALADPEQIQEMLLRLCEGTPEGILEATAGLDTQIREGTDPVAVIEGLAQTCHAMAIQKIQNLLPDSGSPWDTAIRSVRISTLTRFWEILMETLERLDSASSSRLVAGLALIQLGQAASLPDLSRLAPGSLYNPSLLEESLSQESQIQTQNPPIPIPDPREALARDPVIRRALEIFPGATLGKIGKIQRVPEITGIPEISQISQIS